VIRERSPVSVIVESPMIHLDAGHRAGVPGDIAFPKLVRTSAGRLSVAAAPLIPDKRDRLLDIPFTYWGVMPVTADDEDD